MVDFEQYEVFWEMEQDYLSESDYYEDDEFNKYEDYV